MEYRADSLAISDVKDNLGNVVEPEIQKSWGITWEQHCLSSKRLTRPTQAGSYLGGFKHLGAEAAARWEGF